MVTRPLKCFGGGSVHWVRDDSAPVGADPGESRVPGGGGTWDTWNRSESELVPFLLPSSVHTHAAGCRLPSRLCLPIPTHSVRLFLGLPEVMPLAWLGCHLSHHLPFSPNNENNLLNFWLPSGNFPYSLGAVGSILEQPLTWNPGFLETLPTLIAPAFHNMPILLHFLLTPGLTFSSRVTGMWLGPHQLLISMRSRGRSWFESEPGASLAREASLFPKATAMKSRA